LASFWAQRAFGGWCPFCGSFLCSVGAPVPAFSNRCYGCKRFLLACFLLFDRAAGFLPFSNRDGKGKRKIIDLASLSCFRGCFSGSTAPQAFPRPDRRMLQPARTGGVKAGRISAATAGLAFT
jgi:hypothetical protein